LIRHFSYLIVLLLISGLASLLFPRCANIVPPTGGPRDTIPPEAVRSFPSNYSTGFRGTEILIEFDEFIQLRNINQQFIITPPQKERPEFSVRGRNLLIDLRSEPIANTTYTLNFGDAIVDLNENNPHINFEFVFSTGDEIDSLAYSGIVFNALDNKPVEGAIVMLYEELKDSVPYLRMPLYANRTGKDGRFQMNNLRADTFLVFAITDANNNYLYDSPDDETIGFLDQYLILTPDINTYGPDTDTMQVISNAQIIPEDTLYMFPEETGRQYISRSERPGRGELLFVFNKPVSQEWYIDPVNFDPPANWKLIEKNPQMDSIRFWITDPETRNIDNMRFHATYWATGPSDSLKQVSDSLNQNYSAPLRSRRQEASDQDEPVMEPRFGLSSGGNQELNRNLRITFPVPIAATDLSKITLSVIQNGSMISRDFTLALDSLRIRDYQLITEWLPGQDYRFISTPGAFTDIFGLASDSIEFNFKTRERDHYGSIILTITGVNDHIILQVLDERELVLREYFLDTDGKVVIDYLQPAKYLFKVIFDPNKNRKWDTGNYLKGIQPERVMFYRETVPTRSNWDIEVEWDLDD
jgi:hypothetical protein